MGWKKYKRNIMAGLRTMTPIQEESEECRTPTPVNGSSDQEFKENDKTLPSSEATPTEGSRSNSRADGFLGCPMEKSFSDHLQSLVEDYTREIISKVRQLREVRKRKHDLYTEFCNYKLSWTMDRAEMDELRGQLEAERKERERMQKEIYKLAEEHSKVKERLDAILEEKGQTQSRSIRSSVEEEEKQDDIPTAPQAQAKRDIFPNAPQGQGQVQRRPYTGRSRDAQFLPMTENVVVKSSVAPSTSECRGSPVCLPPIASSPPKKAQSPPKLPRPLKSSKSRIPCQLPPLRRGS